MPLGLEGATPPGHVAPMRFVASLISIALTVLVAGCVTGAGPAASVGARPIGTSGVGVAGNGVAGPTLAKAPRGDRARGLAAEFQALEFQPAGEAVEWVGAKSSGTVVALAPFAVGSQNCRQLTHTIRVGETETVARGSACREANGVWTPLG